MNEIATVTLVQDHEVTVAVTRKEACGGCSLCQKLDSNGAIYTMQVARPRFDLIAGDRVVLQISSKAVTRGFLIAYGIPMTFFFAGLFSAYYLFPIVYIQLTHRELFAFITGSVFSVIGFGIVHAIDKKLAHHQLYTPKITKKMKSAEDTNERST